MEKSVEELYEHVEKGEFFKKLFIFNDGQKHYSERLHFFKSIRIFDQPMPSKNKKINTAFQCKICNKTLHANIGVCSNLNGHLKCHLDFLGKWANFFNKFNSKNKISNIDDETYDLVRFIVSSNTALDQLDNIHFCKLLEDKMSIPYVKSFRYEKLPKVYYEMRNAIEYKLSKAITCCFITDIWTNKVLADFIALAAFIVNEFFAKELLVVGMGPMSGDHSAENVKIEIEKIVNSLKFNKSLAKGIY